jgi:hypothetical protein
MKTRKILFGGLAGGLTFFLLGWLLYGILLMGFMSAHSNQCAARPMQDMVWWAIIGSNLALGFLLTLILSWSGITTIMSGVRVSCITGLLLSASMDLSFYSMTTMYSSLAVIIVDIMVYTFMFTVGGIVISWVMGLVKK